MVKRYAIWLDWHLRAVLVWAAWFVFMGVWIAIPVFRAFQQQTNWGAGIVIPGSHGSTFSLSLFGASVLSSLLILLGLTLLISCMALWRGWLKSK